jgi:hypothetical protein
MYRCVKATAGTEANRSGASSPTSPEGEGPVRVASCQFICWNCCGLRFTSGSSEVVCPNCGHEATKI